MINSDLPPTNLEWDMKLWWPHNEAMIAFLMAYNTTQNAQHWERFKEVTDYAYDHVSLNHFENDKHFQ